MKIKNMYAQNLLQDKVALVTGGGSGIGFGIAKLFLQLGARVVIASRNQKKLKGAANELNQFGTCTLLACDIRNTEQVASLAEHINKIFGHLDILVNNAGGQFPALAEMISENGWSAVINNNLNGTFYVSKEMAKSFFIPQKEGVIVNITADVIRGFPGMAHTGAARAGVENLTKSLAQEWACHHIRVNAIAPGIVQSSGLSQYPQAMQDFIQKSKGENLMGRFGTVEDIANAVVFLATPLSSYISGITLQVDGLEHLSSDRMKFFNLIKSFIQ